MPEHHWGVDDEMSDFAMCIIMDVGAANADRVGADTHILRSEFTGNVKVPERELPFFFQHQCLHLILHGLRYAWQRIQSA